MFQLIFVDFFVQLQPPDLCKICFSSCENVQIQQICFSKLMSFLQWFLMRTCFHFASKTIPKSRLGRFLGRLESVLEASWAVLGASWSVLGRLGASWRRLGASWARLGAFQAPKEGARSRFGARYAARLWARGTLSFKDKQREQKQEENLQTSSDLFSS